MIEVDPKTGEPSGTKDRDKRQELRLNDLLNGKENPPNAYTKYIIEKVQKLQQERVEVTGQLRQGEQLLEQLRRRHIELSALVQSLVEDLRRWDKQLAEPLPKKESSNDKKNK